MNYGCKSWNIYKFVKQNDGWRHNILWKEICYTSCPVSRSKTKFLTVSIRPSIRYVKFLFFYITSRIKNTTIILSINSYCIAW